MARRAASPRAQRGVALLALLAVAVMVFAYVLTSRLNAASQYVGIDREHNAKVLSRAKQALIGYMAQQAAMAGENNPGHLPCPEAPANFGTANEGVEASFCAAPAVGRLPWRTLGLEKLVDAAGEPLWYAVSIGWHRPSSAVTLTINSDTLGQLSLDGAPVDKPVALIIASGPAITVQTSGPCTGVAQTRPSAGPPVLSNYLECGNETGTYVTNSPGNTVNDQVLRVNAADVMPALEAAIAERMQREIAPVIKAAAYTSTQYSAIPFGVPVYPYPVPFTTDPTASTYEGAPGFARPQGLLPFNQISGACVAPPPCTTLSNITGTVRSTLYGYLLAGYSCSTSTTEILCQGQYHKDDLNSTRDVRIEMAATFPVAMGFHVLAANPLSHMLVEANDNGTTTPVLTPSPSIVQIIMNNGVATLPDLTLPPAGSVTIRFHATLPNITANGWDTIADFRIRIYRTVFDDHALLNKTDATLGWFVRNEWYRNVYYAVHKRNTADVLALSPQVGCSTDTSALAADRCLTFNDPATYNIRALLVLAGRRLPTQAARPTNNRLDYVEFRNGDSDTHYEQRWPRMSNISIPSPLYAPWNDRIVLVDPLPSPSLPASQVDPITSRIVVTSQP